jgi:RNA polymerase sigma-70 factor (ECF subfamily)
LKTKELIIKCQKGDQAAFSQLYEEFSDMIYSVAFRIVNKENEASDIVQETFISVWENIQKIDPDRKFKNWIMRIAVNKCYDLLRKSSYVNKTVSDDFILTQILSEENTPEEQLNNKEIGDIISLIAEKLSPKQKLVFVLSELEGYSQDEIADMTGMMKSSIKSNLNLARRRIGKQIEKYL